MSLASSRAAWRSLPAFVIQVVGFQQSWRHYASLPELENRPEPPAPEESVTIVIPARNEAGRLPRLLDSLSRLDYPAFRVLVVDDASEDGTAHVALERRCEVVRLRALPEGWLGKSWACWNGALRSESKWILFTDADTVHGPVSLGRAVSTANRTGADMLSVFPCQECRTLWERIILPFAYCLYFAGIRPDLVNTGPRDALANGQYILISKRVYLECEGHSAVRSSIVEDLALAARVISVGGTVRVFRAQSDVSVRMYQSLGDIVEGFSKNAASFAFFRLGSGIVVVGLLVTALSQTSRLLRRPLWPAIGSWLACSRLIAPWYREFGLDGRWAFAYPIAAAAFQLIAIRSLVKSLLGAQHWRGRRLA